ncbi:MAG TPA: MFS transporter, partial [Bacillota bacterium]|nr:MFS transporter [Bacillota bacterium]
WQICYFILGGLSLIFTGLFLMLKLPPLPQSAKITLLTFGKLIIDPKLLIICLCMAFYTGSEIGGWGWMSTFLKQNLKFSATKSSIAVALFWGGMTIGRFICGRLLVRFNLRNIIITLAFLSALITTLSGYITGGLAVLGIVIAMGLAYSSLWPMIASYGGNYHPQYSGTVFALLIASGGIGATVIPLAMGFLAQNINIRMAAISPGILFLLIGLIFVNLKKNPVEKGS